MSERHPDADDPAFYTPFEVEELASDEDDDDGDDDDGLAGVPAVP